MFTQSVNLYDGWRETDEPAANTEALAERSASSGRTHFIVGVIAHYDDHPTTDGDVSVEFDSVAEFELPLVDGVLRHSFDIPVRVPEGQSVGASLPAAGTGISGRVTLLGFTL